MKPLHGARTKQSGAALLVVLMLLIVVTLLGLASMRGAIMQERMAANTVARGKAFQAAEAGLRQAEIIARDGAPSFPPSGCADGLCAMPSPSVDPPWAAADFWTKGAFREGKAVGSGDLALTPRFVIEDFGATVNGGGAGEGIDMSKVPPPTTEQSVFRITSQAMTPSGVEVVVQSLYRR